MSDVNPTTEEALSQVRDAMTAAATFPFSDDALLVVPERVQSSFEQRLKSAGAWGRVRGNVLAAAAQLCIIASAIATLRHDTVITRDMLEIAMNLVQAECRLGADEGQWCT